MWIEWEVPEALRRLIADESGGIVPLEVSQVSETEARVVLLAPEATLPGLRRFLDDLEVPYRLGAMRTLAAGGWQPLTDLTPRQRTLLELAFRLGYYESPSKTDLAHVAELVGISKAAVSKHLRAAERKLLAATLGARQ